MHQQWRKSITTLVFVLFGLGSTGGWAQAPKSPLIMKPDAPDRYVVVPGDTLWSIAQRYTDSPWRWSELWDINKDGIANPHRIYPGNIIVLDRVRGQLAIDEKSMETVKLTPRVRAESMAKAAIPSIPASAIEPFLVRPLVVEADGLDRAPTVVAAEDSRVIMEAGRRVVVRGIGGAKDADWLLYRRGSALVDPESKNILGFEAIYLGTANVVRAGDPAVVMLATTTREISLGDKLIAAGKAEVPSYSPRPPLTRIEARVMSVYGGTSSLGEAGSQTVISINRGKSEGVEPGHVLALYRLGAAVVEAGRSRLDESAKHYLPTERYGLVFVFRVFDRVSYALVMNLSKPVNVQDLVQNP